MSKVVENFEKLVTYRLNLITVLTGLAAVFSLTVLIFQALPLTGTSTTVADTSVSEECEVPCFAGCGAQNSNRCWTFQELTDNGFGGCNDVYDFYCGGTGGSCVDNGASYGNDPSSCCSGLQACPNGRCGTTCIAPECSQESQVCNTQNLCCDGLTCINGTCGDVTQGCTTDSGCSNSQYCEPGINVCSPKRDIGQFCSRDQMCNSGNCEVGVCEDEYLEIPPGGSTPPSSGGGGSSEPDANDPALLPDDVDKVQEAINDQIRQERAAAGICTSIRGGGDICDGQPYYTNTSTGVTCVPHNSRNGLCISAGNYSQPAGGPCNGDSSCQPGLKCVQFGIEGYFTCIDSTSTPSGSIAQPPTPTEDAGTTDDPSDSGSGYIPPAPGQYCGQSDREGRWLCTTGYICTNTDGNSICELNTSYSTSGASSSVVRTSPVVSAAKVFVHSSSSTTFDLTEFFAEVKSAVEKVNNEIVSKSASDFVLNLTVAVVNSDLGNDNTDSTTTTILKAVNKLFAASSGNGGTSAKLIASSQEEDVSSGNSQGIEDLFLQRFDWEISVQNGEDEVYITTLDDRAGLDGSTQDILGDLTDPHRNCYQADRIGENIFSRGASMPPDCFGLFTELQGIRNFHYDGNVFPESLDEENCDRVNGGLACLEDRLVVCQYTNDGYIVAPITLDFEEEGTAYVNCEGTIFVP